MSKKLSLTICILTLFIFNPFKVLSNLNNEASLIFYCNQSRRDLKSSLLKSIKKAKDEIYISVYSLSDPDLIKILNTRANEGLKIEIRVDRKQAISLRKKLSERVSLTTISQSGLMHQKVFLVDNLCYLGSANLTSQSLRMHDNLMLSVNHEKLNDYLKNELFHSDSKGSQIPFKSDYLQLYLMPNKQVLEQILDRLQKAEHSIQIAMFTFTHPKIYQALKEAHQKGVRVRVIFDYLSHKGASRFMAQNLKDENICISHNRGLALMHHKLALIDEETLIMGSTNWTKSGFEKNQESLLLIPKLSKKDKKFVKKVFRHLFWEGKKI